MGRVNLLTPVAEGINSFTIGVSDSIRTCACVNTMHLSTIVKRGLAGEIARLSPLPGVTVGMARRS